MTKIWSTPYTVKDGEITTGISVDSGFETINQACDVMGDPDAVHIRYVVYGTEEERVAFSDFPFS
jgi:hypothetical protein